MNFFGEIDNIVLKEYDGSYPKKYFAEIELLEQTFSSLNPEFHHIGSTAIPNILSKPVIDIAVEVNPFPLDEDKLEMLYELGYVYWALNPDKNHQFFFKNLPRTHHLHVYPRGADKLKKEIVFRDLLIQSKELKNEYELLKKDLASKFSTDREKYTEMKTEFIQLTLERNTNPNKI